MSELLAPAGSYEAFLAAISNGCDAVYLGLNIFSARAYAENFTRVLQLLCYDTLPFFERVFFLFKFY